MKQTTLFLAMLVLGGCSSSTAPIIYSSGQDAATGKDAAMTSGDDAGGIDSAINNPIDAAQTAIDSSTPIDASASNDANSNSDSETKEEMHCGQPGDKGNSLGVGEYCTLAECFSNSKATLCSALGGPGTNFCTFECTQGGAADQCGENATCGCQGGQCGCTPNYCL